MAGCHLREGQTRVLPAAVECGRHGPDDGHHDTRPALHLHQAQTHREVVNKWTDGPRDDDRAHSALLLSAGLILLVT